ncbi:MAG: cation:proton antiporter [Nitratireductor sp.]|nr:cation:proton antiporter [Nitratireductor sp.]
MSGFLFQAFVYLAASVIAVPIAKRLGLGSVLGYLIAGIVIGPVIGLVGNETQNLQHFAEFGVVMMLFIVGLELEPKVLWQMRRRLIGLGGLQVGLTSAVIAAGAFALGLSWQMAIASGLILSLSSTAIVLQTLNEKHMLKGEGGQASFSVLLFQDIAVIPMLALIPLLAVPGLSGMGQDAGAAHGAGQGSGHADVAANATDGAGHATMSLVDGLPGWGVTLVTLGAIAAVVLGGIYLSRPLFRFIADSRLREMFTAAALLLVIAIALLMTLVGLSPALGTFLAGVVLANSEYRHELEADIEPFKGLLLGLFFITVGAGIDFEILFADVGTIVGLTLAVMAAKAIVLLVLARLFRLPSPDHLLFALGLAQAGEFGFVLLSFTLQNSVLDTDTVRMLSLVVAISMLLTPGLFILYDKVLARRGAGDSRDDDAIDDAGPVIIAGHGRFGQVVNRLLMSNGHRTVVIDHSAELVDSLRRFGSKMFYGDASRPDLLHAAGIENAAILVVAIDDEEQAVEIVRMVKASHPHVHVIARASDRLAVYRLYRAGADDIVREMFDSSLRAGRYALEALGMHKFRARKAVRHFEDFDRQTLRELAQHWREDVDVFDNEEYISLARERNQMVIDAMAGANREMHDRTDRGWTPPPKPTEPAGRKAEPAGRKADAKTHTEKPVTKPAARKRRVATTPPGK